MQLKDKIGELQTFFSDQVSEEQRKMVLGENYVKYSDLISEEEQEFWESTIFK